MKSVVVKDTQKLNVNVNENTGSPLASSVWRGTVLSAEAPHGPASSALSQRWPDVLKLHTNTVHAFTLTVSSVVQEGEKNTLNNI